MDRYLRGNRALWDLWAKHHVSSPMYDVEGFKAGRRRGREALDALEVRLVGDVTGKSLLHLQCHFGPTWSAPFCAPGFASRRLRSIHTSGGRCSRGWRAGRTGRDGGPRARQAFH